MGVKVNNSESKTEMAINKSYASLKKAALSIAVSLAVASPLYAATMTRDTGAPVGDNENSQTAGPEDPVLLQDLCSSRNYIALIASAFPSAWCAKRCSACMH
jgi:hypothetical protein